MTNLHSFDDIDDTVLTDLEDTAFKYGVETGLASNLNPSDSFILITQQFLEFLVPEISYSAIGYLDNRKNFLVTYSPYSGFNYTQEMFGMLQKTGLLKKGTASREIHPFDLGRVPKELSSIHWMIPVKLQFQAEWYGTILIGSAVDYEFIWKSRNLEKTLVNLCQIIIKVAKLVFTSETNLYSIINQIDDGIILLCSTKKQIKFINRAARHLLGITNLIHESLKQFIVSIFDPFIKQFNSTQLSFSKELDFKYPVEKSLKIDFYQMNDASEVLIVIRDISHYKEVDRMKTEIISTVSHELRTPLTAIDSMIRNMLRGVAGELNSKVSEYLERMKNNTARLSNLINNLLDLSKLESGEVSLRRKNIDMAIFLERIFASLDEKLKSKDIHVAFRISKKTSHIFADPEKLDQLVINFLGNAIKFVEERGKIIVSSEQKDGYSLIHIIDNGPGIPEENKQDIFKKFKQVGRVYGAGEKGTGLGLSICSEIIKLHHGKITLDSPPKKYFSKGSQFTLFFPLFSDEETLFEMLSDRSQSYRETKINLALIRLLFFEDIDIKERLDEHRVPMNNVIERISRMIKKDFDEVLIFPKSQTVFLFLMIDQNGVNLILKRIFKDLRANYKNVFSGGTQAMIKNCRIKMYPHDSDDLRYLIRELFKDRK